MPHAIQPMKQFNYCMKHSWSSSSLVSVIRIGFLDHLTPLDFFLWSYLKSKIYVNNPITTRALQEEIKLCINEIQP